MKVYNHLWKEEEALVQANEHVLLLIFGRKAAVTRVSCELSSLPFIVNSSFFLHFLLLPTHLCVQTAPLWWRCSLHFTPPNKILYCWLCYLFHWPQLQHGLFSSYCCKPGVTQVLQEDLQCWYHRRAAGPVCFPGNMRQLIIFPGKQATPRPKHDPSATLAWKCLNSL